MVSSRLRALGDMGPHPAPTDGADARDAHGISRCNLGQACSISTHLTNGPDIRFRPARHRVRLAHQPIPVPASFARHISHVLSARASEQVQRRDTPSNIAVVANIQPLRLRPEVKPIRQAVHIQRPAADRSNATVAIRGARSDPQPAHAQFRTVGRDWSVLINLGPEALLKRRQRDRSTADRRAEFRWTLRACFKNNTTERTRLQQSVTLTTHRGDSSRDVAPSVVRSDARAFAWEFYHV